MSQLTQNWLSGSALAKFGQVLPGDVAVNCLSIWALHHIPFSPHLSPPRPRMRICTCHIHRFKTLLARHFGASISLTH